MSSDNLLDYGKAGLSLFKDYADESNWWISNQFYLGADWTDDYIVLFITER